MLVLTSGLKCRTGDHLLCRCFYMMLAKYPEVNREGITTLMNFKMAKYFCSKFYCHSFLAFLYLFIYFIFSINVCSNSFTLGVLYYLHLLIKRSCEPQYLSIATELGVDDRGSIPDRNIEFFSSPQRQNRLWSPPSPYQMGTEVKNTWSYTSTAPYFFMEWCLIKHRGNFIVYLYLLNCQSSS
jgi:hypothetical protein